MASLTGLVGISVVPVSRNHRLAHTWCLTLPFSSQEQEQLYLRSGVVSSATFEQPGRQVKLWVKMVTPLIKNFF